MPLPASMQSLGVHPPLMGHLQYQSDCSIAPFRSATHFCCSQGNLVPLWLSQAGPDPRIIAAADGLQGYDSKSPKQRKSVIRPLLELGSQYLQRNHVPRSATQGSSQQPSFQSPAAQAATPLRPASPNLDNVPASRVSDRGQNGAAQADSLIQQPAVVRQPHEARPPGSKPVSSAGPATTYAKRTSKRSPAAAPERIGPTISEIVAEHGPPEVICYDLETSGTMCLLQCSCILPHWNGADSWVHAAIHSNVCYFQCRGFAEKASSIASHCPDGNVPHYRGGRKGGLRAAPMRTDSGFWSEECTRHINRAGTQPHQSDLRVRPLPVLAFRA